MKNQQHFHANGKLLLSGEYFVLDGALAIGLPARFGQSLSVMPTDDAVIHWQSLTYLGEEWFQATYSLDLEIIATNDEGVATTLQTMLKYIKDHTKQDLFSHGWQCISALDFPRNWGLGSSSTLLCTLSKWSGVNAFELSKNTLGGSGYDIACGMTDAPIFYQIVDGQPTVKPVNFAPTYKDNIYFVHLGKKQNSREGIKRYRTFIKENWYYCKAASQLTTDFVYFSKDLESFEETIQAHEDFISEKLQLPKAKDLYFEDFEGSIKSLGAWGGDFVLATSEQSEEATKAYFLNKGFTTVLTYREMIL